MAFAASAVRCITDSSICTCTTTSFAGVVKSQVFVFLSFLLVLGWKVQEKIIIIHFQFLYMCPPNTSFKFRCVGNWFYVVLIGNLATQHKHKTIFRMTQVEGSFCRAKCVVFTIDLANGAVNKCSSGSWNSSIWIVYLSFKCYCYPNWSWFPAFVTSISLTILLSNC